MGDGDDPKTSDSKSSLAKMPTQIVNNYHTTTQDNSAFPITTVLNENNYSMWAPLMQMRIGGRGKGAYLTGVTPSRRNS